MHQVLHNREQVVICVSDVVCLHSRLHFVECLVIYQQVIVLQASLQDVEDLLRITIVVSEVYISNALEPVVRDKVYLILDYACTSRYDFDVCYDKCVNELLLIIHLLYDYSIIILLLVLAEQHTAVAKVLVDELVYLSILVGVDHMSFHDKVIQLVLVDKLFNVGSI